MVEEEEEVMDDIPQYSDYQVDNFVEHNGLRISAPSHNVAELNYYNLTNTYNSAEVKSTNLLKTLAVIIFFHFYMNKVL